MSPLTLLCIVVLVPFALCADKKIVDVEDVCTFDCIKDLYAEFCGGAECVHGTKTPEQKEAMCSDKCLDVLFGKAAHVCLAKNLPEGADTQDFLDFLKEGIYEFCFDGEAPPEEAPSSEEAFQSMLYESHALDLVDGDM